MHVTDAIILAVLTFIAVADVVLILRERASFSRRLRLYGSRCVSIPFGFGVVAGHFWGPGGDPPGGWVVSIALLLLIAAAVSPWHRVVWQDPPKWAPLVYVLPGAFFGMMLWPM
jgi:hypothetical protein